MTDIAKINVRLDETFLTSRGSEIWSNAKSGRGLFDERMVKDLDLYNSRFSPEERKYSEFLSGTARLFIPKTYTSTQRILVDEIEAFYPDPEELCDIASYKNVPYETRQIVKALMNYRLGGHGVNFYQELYEFCLDATRNMIGIFKIYPRLRTQAQPKKVQIQDQMTGEVFNVDHPTETEEVITAFSPRLEAIPPEDVFFSKSATWKDYWKFPMCHRYEKTVGELLAMGFKNVLEAPATSGNATTDIVGLARSKELDDQSRTETNALLKTSEKRVVYEFYDIVPDENGEMRSGSWFSLGDKSGPSKIARGWEWNELPYQFDEFETVRHPFVVGCAFPESHQLYGKSFPWITESNQREINAVANQEREAFAKALRPATYVNRDGNIDLVALMNRRIGATVQGDGPAEGNIKELQTMNPAAITPAQRARVDQDYAEAGIPSALAGGQSTNDTATESTQQLGNANKKIALILKNLAFTGVLPAFNYLLRLEQMYESDEFVEMVTGRVLGWGLADDALPARDYIQGDFDLRVNLGMNKQAQVSKLFLLSDRGAAANQSMVQMLQLGLVDPSTAKFADTSKPWIEAAKILGFKDVEDNWLLPALPPQQPANEAAGMASQPGMIEDPSSATSQTMPEAPGAALSVL